jgi:two-component system C4-dicarboxylate transport response regulator DctD
MERLKTQRLAPILLFEDDGDVRHAIEQSLELDGFAVESFSAVEDCPGKISTDFRGVVVSDIRLPGADGRQLFRQLQNIDPEIPVILITGHGELQEAVDLMREGVYDFISKPFPPARLIASVRNALEHRALVIENRAIRNRSREADIPLPLIGESERIVNLRSIVRDLSDVDVNILIVGETGTGKESIAKAMHARTAGVSRPFSVLDCASLPDGLLEAELFGTEEVVAGMRRHKGGRIESADKGTLFLDAIDNLSLSSQGRLLRVVEEKQVIAIGAITPRAVSCRVIAAATQDLSKMCAEGVFRSDLFFRLNTVTLHLPPLRERREDIPALFIALLSKAAQRLRRPTPAMTKSIRNHLLDHSWPGNIRELSHFADRVVLGIESTKPSIGELATDPLPQLVERFEASLIKEALRASGGKVKRCLEILKVPRKTFYDKVARFGIDLTAFRDKGR